MPYPLPLTRTEAYLAYKAGVIQQSDLKPSLAVPRNGIDAWLAYWTGLAADYPKREDGTPHILQEEEAYIAYLCGVINEYPEKCLRRVGAYLRYLISARWGRPDHPLNREELYLSLIKTQFIPSGDPSSDIVIDGTAKAPFVDVKMYGDTYQQSYTGKNLYNIEAIPYAAKRAYGSDGTVLSWTDYVGTAEYQPVEPNTQYTLWNDSIGNTTYLCEYDENKNFIQRLIAVTTFTTTATTKYLRWSLNVGTGEIPPTRTQLQLGSTVTSFEPYVGGQASPNPDYPQPIQTVTGEQTVEVHGKNLFDYMGYTGAILRGGGSGATISNPSGNTLRVTNHIAQANNFAGIFIDNPSSLLGKDVTISANVDAISGQTKTKIALFFGTETGVSTQIESDNTISSTGAHSLTCTVPSSFPSGMNAILVVLYGNGDGQGAVFGGDGTYVEWSNVQLEIGSTASDYAPYSKQTYTIDLGDNELEITDGTLTSSGVKCIMDSNSATITRTSANSNTSFIRYQLDAPITIHSGETFTLYAGNIDTIGDKTTTGAYMSVRLRTSNNTDDTNTDTILGNINAKTTITATEDVTYTHFVIRTSSSLYPDNLVITPRLVIGQDNSIELCKLGTYQDYIYKDGESWKVHKAVEKLQLVSSQGWAKSSTMATLDRYFIRDYFPSGTIPSDLSAIVVQSNYFTAISQSASDGGAYGICQLNGRGMMINTVLGAFSNNDAFKNWLDSNSVNAYYALATPTDTTITDTTLIAQLDSLVNGGAEDGTTYIKVKANDPNLPAKLYVEAPKYE